MWSVVSMVAAASLTYAVALWMRRRGQAPAACAAAAAMWLVNPFTWEAIRLGYAPELLGSVLCVGAVLAALRGHALPAAFLLCGAIAADPWALIALGPALAATPGRRMQLMCFAGIALLLRAAGGVGASGGFDPLVALAVTPLAACWWVSPRRTPDDVLAVLALTFLLADVLDQAGDARHLVPFALALLAWEGLTRRGLPVASAALFVTYYTADQAGAPAELAALAIGAWMALRLFVPSLMWRPRAWPLPVPRTPVTENRQG